MDAPVSEVYYEDLIEMPQKTIRKVFSDLELTGDLDLAPGETRIKMGKVPLKKQGNQLNDKYYQAIKHSFSYD